MDKHPDFLIMGAMKCATSTLHEQLALQPGFFMSELKEPNFFSNDEQYARGMDWYLSLFQGAPEHSLCGESSTHYTKLPTYPNTIDRIGKHLPQVKLIYVMRHPIDRLVSQYVHEWSQGRVST
ncbi:MAG: sulfotransferase domain-containing protein, partial [Geitlerinemataceae cyanobacterium]